MSGTNNNGGSRNHAELPIPNGWYAVAWSEELAPGDVKSAHYFDKELVLFRTESGKACVFDAYCPHLGAHLGVGGKVEGESIRCPFHAWRYDTGGTCVEIPYAKRIPAKARTKAWDVVERNGMVMAWHHRDNKPPFFEAPSLSEFSDPEWAIAEHWDLNVNVHVQEMAENNCDPAHFIYIHGSEEIPTSDLSYDGLTMKMSSTYARDTVIGSFDAELERIAWGLGLASVRIKGIPGAGLLMFSSTTPIDNAHSHSRWAFAVTKNLEGTVGAEFVESLKAEGGVMADVPIWENKIHRPDPLLCDGDRFIGEFRRWAKNFY